jgi:hypothetical protein
MIAAVSTHSQRHHSTLKESTSRDVTIDRTIAQQIYVFFFSFTHKENNPIYFRNEQLREVKQPIATLSSQNGERLGKRLQASAEHAAAELLGVYKVGQCSMQTRGGTRPDQTKVINTTCRGIRSSLNPHSAKTFATEREGIRE